MWLDLAHLPERTAKLRRALLQLDGARRGGLAHALNVEPYVVDDACDALRAPERPTAAQVLGLAVVLGGLSAAGHARGLRRAFSLVLDTPEIVIVVGAEVLTDRLLKSGLVPPSLVCPDCGFTPRQAVA
jgi:hypothetical protein